MGHPSPGGAGTPTWEPDEHSSRMRQPQAACPSVSLVLRLQIAASPQHALTAAVRGCPSGLNVTPPSRQSGAGDREASWQFKGLEGDQCHSPNQLLPSPDCAKPFVGPVNGPSESLSCQHDTDGSPLISDTPISAHGVPSSGRAPPPDLLPAPDDLTAA